MKVCTFKISIALVPEQSEGYTYIFTLHTAIP